MGINPPPKIVPNKCATNFCWKKKEKFHQIFLFIYQAGDSFWLFLDQGYQGPVFPVHDPKLDSTARALELGNIGPWEQWGSGTKGSHELFSNLLRDINKQLNKKE